MIDDRPYWDELARIHFEQNSEFYNVDAFIDGATSLRALELSEVGDVRGKSMLHLQCHFGLDTLSWARRGANVVGVDFSPEAIKRARELATRCGLEARFVCADVLELEDVGTFDVVFTSHGTTTWLGDLDRWASVIARSLAPNGFFYIADAHPFSGSLDRTLRVAHSYFQHVRARHDGSDAVPGTSLGAPSREYAHSLGAIVTALARAGLRIEYLHEHAFADWPSFDGMQRGDDGYYRFARSAPSAPLMYSLRARK